MDENDTFSKLKYPTYKLVVDIFIPNEEEFDDVIDMLRTTLDEPDFDEYGNMVYRHLSLDEVLAEIFCLGSCSNDIIEKFGFHVIDYEVTPEW